MQSGYQGWLGLVPCIADGVAGLGCDALCCLGEGFHAKTRRREGAGVVGAIRKPEVLDDVLDA